MNESDLNWRRREAMQQGARLTVLGMMLSAGMLRPANAQAAWNAAAFEAGNLSTAMKALGAASAREGPGITLTAPEIAENGAVVPVAVSTTLEGVEEIAIFVEKNPNALVAIFDVRETGSAAVTTRLKMAQSSDVYAVVKAGGKYHFTRKEVKVTLGGCGG